MSDQTPFSATANAATAAATAAADVAVTFYRAVWYRVALLAIFAAPAVVCQTVWPVVPIDFWESLSEPVYGELLRWQAPLASEPSKVAVIEVDDATIDELGWPIQRRHFAHLLERLKGAGHPWVMSFYLFNTLGKGVEAQAGGVASSLADQDAELASAIAGYDRYVGSGLKFIADEELDADVEAELMPRVTFTRSGEAAELPLLRMNLVEDRRFVEGQRAFGFATRFVLSDTVSCMQSYLTDKEQTGAFVLPSSLVWVATLARGARLVTATGAEWPAGGVLTGPVLRVAYEECLTSPSLTTLDYLAQRRIERHPMHQVLAGDVPDLTGKVVLISSKDSQLHRGPGRQISKTDDGVVPEHLLAARFLDGLMTDRLIARLPLEHSPLMNWLPIVFAALLLAAGFLLPTLATLTIAGLLALGLLAFSGINLSNGSWIIPVQTLVSVAATAAGLAALYAYLRYHAVRRQIRFAARLNEALAGCNTLEEIEARTRVVAAGEFVKSKIRFDGYDQRLYAALRDAQAALALLHDSDASGGSVDAALVAEVDAKTGLPTELDEKRSLFSLPTSSLSLPVESKIGRLGFVRLTVKFRGWERDFIADLLELLRQELAQHWHRVKLLADQKLLDYRFLMEQTRGEIMSRFLTHALVSKFSDGRTMDENLRLVLTPRTTRCALMQADIRGYSRISSELNPADMVRMLQGYFRNVVDAAQLVAQVKLIGDCIFLFIEDEAGTAEASPADLALELAGILVTETLAQNALRARDKLPELEFGIAIHYGEVVVGNLSSDSCIDYTVIGPNVNLVARLEELTKSPKVGAAIGANGVLLSVDARSALVRHKSLSPADIDLATLGLTVRSFPSVQRLFGIRAQQAMAIDAGSRRQAS